MGVVVGRQREKCNCREDISDITGGRSHAIHVTFHASAGRPRASGFGQADWTLQPSTLTYHMDTMGLYQTVAVSLNRATLRFRKVLVLAEVVTAVVMFLWARTVAPQFTLAIQSRG